MLRPATPLAILLFAAFALLLMSVLSTPIIEAIPLGTFEGVSFGVFGFCKGDGCSPFEIGYDTSSLFSEQQSATFDLPSSARTTLSAILIIHPVAALFTLIMLVLAIVAHLHSPSHSSRYLLIMLIFGIITFIVCLLSFLIDVLLFVPHMAWGSYIVLAATILVALSGLVSCAMRRTVVSRKARKKRIAENAEMSGENYYNRTAQQQAPVATTLGAVEPTVPVVSGGNGPSDKPPFVTYEKKDDRSSDERVPLTARTPSQRSPNQMPAEITASDIPYSGPTPPRSAAGSSRSLPRDQYGNPMPQLQDAYGVRRGPPIEQANMRDRIGPPGGYRGRGNNRGGYGGPYGPPPNGRGGYGPQGRGGYGYGPGGRGGYGPRGGYGAGGMRGGRPPPPGYPGNGGYDRRPPPQPDAYGNYGPGPGRQGSPATVGAPYGMNPSMPSASTGTTGMGGYEAYHPDRVSELPRAESPPPLPGVDDAIPAPVGQAVEMDARTGSPAHPPQGFGQFNNQLRDSDADVAGMLALQQGGSFPPQRHETYMSEGSKYSQDEHYTPPRQAWNQGPGRNSPKAPSPLSNPAGPTEHASATTPSHQTAVTEGSTYYEDVDPRFAEPAPRPLQPGTLQTGFSPSGYDDFHDGSRSPAASEQSVFTSVSQRGVNPRWNSPPLGPQEPLGSRSHGDQSTGTK
ncbi:SUR7/PalI family-domain-containing protein [Pseudomassariella vexata]|uniref:SUR7/PalI family-domain-containing protein n=1 Tax=Pseudomassariella vexata TaxID=1141098 RepID=A0A1Y2E8E7_9PEZI|nr:SUR7/PalI family-domain-containing protein [Pseudomassariella vexata]ORY67707.1 SUR7/PalI family-domain-containing protein [Pseudomassariella vexata]